jgi:bifunctional DNA-binding transcriptional regulator/antitoxin component of YhaV-PrlF toxin-antitoxin module
VEEMKTFTSEIKSRGQLTIPKKLRAYLDLEDGQSVSMIPLGEAIIVTPKKLELDEARRQLRKILKASGCSLEELFAALKEERGSLYQELYGKKKN